TLQTPWNIALHHVNGTTHNITTNDLSIIDKDWNTFAGIIEYRTQFRTTTNKRTWLDLGHLRDVTQLELNGRPLGTKWHGEHLYEVTSAATEGDNYLTIRLTTTLGNYMKTLNDNKTAKEWTRRSPNYPVGLKEVALLHT
ncbi:MAG TPA: glycosylhydrolase-like jelly roll fold domain-containing protein, partial [Puia sp.]